METDAQKAFQAQVDAYMKDHDDLMTPSKLNAAYMISDMGTDLDAIEPFTAELTDIVDKMKEELANETRILEGTDVPEYQADAQNELSEAKLSEEEWRNFLLNGSSRTARILTSIPGSSTLSSSVRPNSPASPTPGCDGKFCERSMPSSWGISAGCGCGTAAMNESSECTVPTISEPTLGMQSEEK